MKNSPVILLAVLVLLLTCSAADAQLSNPPPESLKLTANEKAWLADHPAITLTTYSDGAPYGFIDEQGEYIGVIPDIVARIGQLLGIQIRFKPLEYRALIEQLKNGSADITTLNDPADMPYAEHYLKTEEFLFLPYALFVRSGFRPADDPDHPLAGKTIALVEGWDLSNPSLSVLRGSRFIFADSMLACINLVLQDKADGLYDIHSEVNYSLWKNALQDLKVLKVYNEGYPVSFFVRRDWPALKSALQKALSAISRDERAELLMKWNAFMGDASYRLRMLDLSPTERQWLRKHPVVRVGMDGQLPPLEFLDDDGRQQGISMEYLGQIEKMLGLHFDIIVGSTDRLRGMADSRNVDMLSCAVQPPAGSGYLAFTRPYMSLPVVLMTRTDSTPVAGLKELTGKKAAVVNGSVIQQWLAADAPDIELVPAQSVEKMLDLLDNGRVSAGIESLPVAGYFLEKQARGDMKVSGQTPYTYPIRMAVRADWPLLAGILQKALDAIPPDQRATDYRRWMAVSRERVLDWGLLWKVLLPLFAALAFFIYWTRRLFREVGSRKRAEAQLRTAQDKLEQLNQGLEQRVAERTSELEQASHTLRESEERFRAIAEHSPDAMLITDSSAAIVYCNSAAESMFGYRPDELAGKPVTMLLGDCTRTGESEFIGSTVESWAARKDGTEFPIEFSLFSWEIDGQLWFGALTRDITDRKTAEDNIRQARDYMENVFRTSPDAITVTDPEGYIIMANESVASVYGYEPAELLGQHASVLATEQETACQRTLSLVEEVFEHGLVRGWLGDRRRKDGRTIQVETSIALLKNPDGTHSGSISSSRDITEKRRMEEQVRQTQKLEAIGTLAGGIAHDFNNILCAIIGFAELSQDLAGGNSRLEKNLAQVLLAGERAKNLVKQILAFSRKSEHELRPLQMHLIIKETLKLLRASLPSSIEILCRIEERMDIIIADPTQIHQIVMNLCTNAAQAMQQAGGTLEIRLKPVEIDDQAFGEWSGIATGPHLQLSVRDTGSGIDHEIMGRIFEPFFTTKGVDRGTGMGLAVVHGIVKSLRGDIKATSQPGTGTIFYVLLPRVEDAPAQARKESSISMPRGSESVLLVDDEQLLLDMGSQMLESLGYRTLALRSPLEALEAFTADPAGFDIVITDQTMPKLTGYELAGRLLRIRPGLPIILCTGYSDAVNEESAMSLGIRAFMIKPLNWRVLAQSIRSSLDN